MTSLLHKLKTEACTDQRTKHIAKALLLDVPGVPEMLTALCYAIPNVAELLPIPTVSVRSYVQSPGGDALLVLDQKGAPQAVAADNFIGTVRLEYLYDPILRVSNYKNDTVVEFSLQEGRAHAVWPEWSGLIGAIELPDDWAPGYTMELSAPQVYPYAEKKTQLLQDSTAFDFLAKYGYVESVFQQGDPREAVAVAVYCIYKALS